MLLPSSSSSPSCSSCGAFWPGEYARFSPFVARLIPRASLHLPHSSSLSSSPLPSPPVGPRAYPLIPLSARTTIRSADVSPSRIASEKIGLAPAPQLLGPAMLQSRELVASSWHGLGRFRVNFIFEASSSLLYLAAYSLAWVYIYVYTHRAPAPLRHTFANTTDRPAIFHPSTCRYLSRFFFFLQRITRGNAVSQTNALALLG